MTTSIEQVSQKYRGLRFNSIAEQLPVLLSQAEANDELGYLPMNKQGNYNLFQLINSL